jgi:hypothetical protein
LKHHCNVAFNHLAPIYWCCQHQEIPRNRIIGAANCLLVELEEFHQDLVATAWDATNTLVEQCQLHQYIGGKLFSKISVSILNRQCAAMSPAPIMDHGVMFTFLVCKVLPHFFTSYMRGGTREGRLPIGHHHAKLLRHHLIIKDDISPHVWQI